MNYFKLHAPINSIVTISESLSLKQVQLAPDLLPVWIEIPAVKSTVSCRDGCFIDVTPDFWIVYEDGSWRPMTNQERYRLPNETFNLCQLNAFSQHDLAV